MSDMGPRPSSEHSIDRIDNNGNYEPSNCRWATSKEQARNDGRTRRLTLNGVTLSIAEWAEQLGIGKSNIFNRLNAGWPVERVLDPNRASLAGRPKGKAGSGRAPTRLGETPEYVAWRNMKGRCLNPNHQSWAHYGAKGITVYEPWIDSFKMFLADMGLRPSPTHSLDRIDVNGHYSPANCRWATKIQQERNTTHNKRLTYEGQTLTLSEWAEQVGIPVERIRSRLRSGKSVEEALSKAKRAPKVKRFRRILQGAP
jgi:hypothetical protein